MKDDGQEVIGESPLGVLEWLMPGRASARLLNFLIIQREFDYSETDIAECSGVSLKTVYREIPKFEALGIVNNVRRVGKAKMYRLNNESEIAKLLIRLSFEIAGKRIKNDNLKNRVDENENLPELLNK